MGLDMYVRTYKPDEVEDVNGLAAPKADARGDEIQYWRKHHDLHGWMEALYRSKGGTDEFNCVYVELTLADLDALETDIKERRLPETTGFFFGNNPPDADSDEADLEFIARARSEIESGLRVFYSSWW